MTAATPAGRLLTIDEYADLPDDDLRVTELVRGMVVREPRPSYEHGRIQGRIAQILIDHIDAHAPELVCVVDFGVIVEQNPATVRGPDLAVMRKDRATNLHRAGFLWGAPDLAIEIVSPSNRAADIQLKAAQYLAAGSAIVWVVYPDTRTVAVLEGPSTARFLAESDELTGGDLMPDFRVTVERIFR
jgi:Uma2 family endonuclease